MPNCKQCKITNRTKSQTYAKLEITQIHKHMQNHKQHKFTNNAKLQTMHKITNNAKSQTMQNTNINSQTFVKLQTTPVCQASV